MEMPMKQHKKHCTCRCLSIEWFILVYLESRVSLGVPGVRIIGVGLRSEFGSVLSVQAAYLEGGQVLLDGLAVHVDGVKGPEGLHAPARSHNDLVGASRVFLDEVGDVVHVAVKRHPYPLFSGVMLRDFSAGVHRQVVISGVLIVVVVVIAVTGRCG